MGRLTLPPSLLRPRRARHGDARPRRGDGAGKVARNVAPRRAARVRGRATLRARRSICQPFKRALAAERVAAAPRDRVLEPIMTDRAGQGVFQL